MFVKGLRQEGYSEFELGLQWEPISKGKKNPNFFFISFFFFLLHNHLSLSKCVWMLCLHVYLCTKYVSSACKGQERTSDALGLEFHTVISYHRVLGFKPGFSERTDRALKYWAIMLPCHHIIYFYSFSLASHCKIFSISVLFLLFSKNVHNVNRWAENVRDNPLERRAWVFCVTT